MHSIKESCKIMFVPLIWRGMAFKYIFILLSSGNVPCPIVYGAVVDSACLVWEYACGERGACWLYDSNVFRMFYHGTYISEFYLKLHYKRKKNKSCG